MKNLCRKGMSENMNKSERNSVLIVDDEKSNIITLTRILGDEYTVKVANNGAYALKVAQSQKPELILLDILMPGMDGYEVMEKLRQTEETKDIPVIFISGLDSEEAEEKGLSLGAADYISKPFKPTVVKLRVYNQIQIIRQLRTIERLNSNLSSAMGDLESAMEELKQSSHAKSTFLANMSHEIRTPMNAIIGISEILLQSDGLTDEIKTGIGKIYNSSDLLLGIINDILDMSKIEAGKMETTIEDYDVASLINDTVNLNLMRFSHKPLEFKLEVNADTPAHLTGDALRIKQILNNLLSNAVKYTKKGEVVFSVDFTRCEDDDKKIILVFSVKDTGVGMSEKELAKLFDDYTRFNMEANRQTQGTGLGMSITHNLLLLMGGEIDVKSKPGEGSLFVVKIPQKRVSNSVLGEETAQSLKNFDTNSLLNNKKSSIIRTPMPYGSVLVVDDVETNLYVARGLLKPYKLKIETAMSGRESIDMIIGGKSYDIVFMDHMMPGMDGIEATKRLREVGYTSPIVALTANAVSGQAEVFLQNGFDGFISKPVDVRELDSALRKFVKNKNVPENMSEGHIDDNDDNDDNDATSTILIESFVRDARKAVKVLNELFVPGGSSKNFNTENIKNFTITVHGMKSSLFNIGEKELSETAKQLETAAREQNLKLIVETAPEFIKNLNSLLARYEPKDSDITEEEPDDLKGKLLQIYEFCDDYDRKSALDLITSIKGGRKETRELLDDVKEKILLSDYEEAAQVLKEFLKVLK